MGSTFGARRYNFDWRSFITPGVKLLVLVCTGVFLVQTLLQILVSPDFEYHRFKQVFGLVPSAILPGLRIWQPFTYIFLHGGLWHLLISMLMLWMFGGELGLLWRNRGFLNCVFLCGAGAELIEVVVVIVAVFLGGPVSLLPPLGAS